MKEQKSSFKMFFTIGLLLLIFLGIFVVIKTADASVEGGLLKVKGIYGVSIPISEIREVKKLETLPSLGVRRVNGIGLGPIKIGYFRYNELGSVKLCILKNEAPYILVITDEQKILIGLGKEKNEELYNKLKDNL